jgi:hypothetical protein
MPSLPFVTVDLDVEAACDACRRPVRAGGRMVDAGVADGRSAARLCLTCARRALLAWSDSRRREAVAARRLAQALGPTYTPLREAGSAAWRGLRAPLPWFEHLIAEVVVSSGWIAWSRSTA